MQKKEQPLRCHGQDAVVTVVVVVVVVAAAVVTVAAAKDDRLLFLVLVVALAAAGGESARRRLLVELSEARGQNLEQRLATVGTRRHRLTDEAAHVLHGALGSLHEVARVTAQQTPKRITLVDTIAHMSMGPDL
jgi:hypothetical protein